MPTKESLLRSQFLRYVFGEQEGYVCIAVGTPIKNNKDKFSQEFFKWPSQQEDASKFIEGARSKNVWFGVNLLDAPDRTKPHCLPTNLIWADLDTCHPDILNSQPQVIIESSPDRYQALWKLNENIPAAVAEEYSKRVYSKYKINGVDSGWALTKLLRVPFTLNYKYSSTPSVNLLKADDSTTDPTIFESMLIEELSELGLEDQDLQLPDLVDLPSAESVIYAHRFELKKSAFAELYTTEPGEDWSSALWRLIKICLEAGMTREEAFVVASTSKCNKYERDKRPVTHLWLDVVKADTVAKTFAVLSGSLDNDLEFPEIINDDERELIEPTFIDNYVKWASVVTDANEVYHELCGTMLLSILLADKLHLNVPWGKVIPNLWGLVLGESTITRKTTAMELAIEFVLETDPELIISAQDSSAEGLLTALSLRPEKVSVYYRDEVAGFFDGMSKKSYLAGMPETLTKLYDVPAYLPRQLRKETITVIKPVFIFFGGGIQNRVYEAVDANFFDSGFLPRFLVVNGESDIDNIRWIGPAVQKTTTDPRTALRTELQDMIAEYRVQIISTKILGQDAEISKEVEVVLTEDAWDKMRAIEKTLVITANESAMAEIALPTFTRLSTSLLKMAMLYAAIRQEPKDFKVQVELHDILKAAKYVMNWAPFTIHMMSNVGTSASERMIQRVLRSVRAHPGMTRAECMRRHHLQSMPAKLIFSTLEERGLIITKQAGRGYKLWPV